MKTKIIVSLTLVFVLAMPLVFAETVNLNDPKYHESLAASYEQKALEQDALILEHQQMKKDVADRAVSSPKSGPVPVVKEMEKHCNAIINDAQILKTELQEFAKWHRMRAAELQGR